MNCYFLRFLDKKMENKYQSKQRESTFKYHQIQSIVVILLLLLFVIINAYEQFWIDFSMSSGFLVITAISLIINGNKQYYTTLVIAITLVYNYYQPFAQILSLSSNDQFYIDGYMACLATTAVISEISFFKKAITFTSIYVMLQVFDNNSIKTKWGQTIQYTLYLTLYIIKIYKVEQLKRQDFLQQTKLKKGQQQLIQQSGIILYVVTYKRDKNQLLLIEKDNNEIITEELQSQFISQIRNMKIFIKDQESITVQQSYDAINLDSKMSLEKFLFYFMTCPEKLKEQIKQTFNATYDDQIKLQGVLNQENYNIQIAKYYDIQASAIILIQQNKKDIFIEELQLKFKIFKQAFETINEIFQSQIKMSLIYFSGLLKNNTEKGNNKNNILMYKKIQSKIFRAYNDFSNIKDFFNLNTTFQRSIIQQFDIIVFIETILQEVQQYFYKSKKFSYKISNSLKIKTVFQEQRQLKQLLLNLLYFVTEFSQNVTIYIDEGNLFLHQKPFLRIRLEYQGSCLSKDSIKGLPFINPSTIQELKHNSQQAYSLNLPMAIVIVRKIGPINKLFMKQNKYTHSLEFFIFKELQEDFHLMPLQSQHPINYLVTNSRSILHRKQSAYFDLMSLSPRIQIDNDQFNI